MLAGTSTLSRWCPDTLVDHVYMLAHPLDLTTCGTSDVTVCYNELVDIASRVPLTILITLGFRPQVSASNTSVAKVPAKRGRPCKQSASADATVQKADSSRQPRGQP